jgi:penicillin-binding protein 1C
VTYGNRWNAHDVLPLHDVPLLLRQAFLTAEDRRFFKHSGVDWRARSHAVVQNLRARRAVRGASTITEQVVRMLHPRSRSVWTRWVEGMEACELEHRHGKGEILEFYLNQVPYARQRRGVVQAARDYFDRDLDTLTAREMLALAVLVRSPSRLDLRRGPVSAYFDDAVGRLADRLHERSFISEDELDRIRLQRLELRDPELDVHAPHFVQYVRDHFMTHDQTGSRARTTLDGSLQRRVEAMLEERVAALAARGVSDGAVLVVNHRTNEILAWVNAGGYSTEREGSQIDALLTPRQPGSTLKPFLYALALEQGWTASTLIDDTPFAGQVGLGLHRFRNYSRLHHGPLRLRNALGNSLNIPAVRTIRAVSPGAFHQVLRDLGFESLDRHPNVYGEGLALGNGEVTLNELVGAFATLARGGLWAPFRAMADTSGPPQHARRVLDEEIASLIANMLADPGARSLEFGTGGVLDLPVETAVKTGTSNDYRDAWSVGFSDRHTVGVWMGDLGRREMDGVSGSIGPALVLRAVFAELRRGEEPRPLFLSRKLRRVQICRESGAAALPQCPLMEEWFRREHVPDRPCPIHGPYSNEPASSHGAASEENVVRLLKPTEGLHLAMDPRIPDDVEAFAFEVASPAVPERIEWFVDDVLVATTDDLQFTWPLVRGKHTAHARLSVADSSAPVDTERVQFVVK